MTGFLLQKNKKIIKKNSPDEDNKVLLIILNKMYFGFIANYLMHKQCPSNVQYVKKIFDVRVTLSLDISKHSVQQIKAFS